jgi:DNA-binding XRE family transcriptional regulator
MIVKKLRDRKSWTQEQLAEFWCLNVRTIGRVKSGKKKLAWNITKLCLCIWSRYVKINRGDYCDR